MKTFISYNFSAKFTMIFQDVFRLTPVNLSLPQKKHHPGNSRPDTVAHITSQATPGLTQLYITSQANLGLTPIAHSTIQTPLTKACCPCAGLCPPHGYLCAGRGAETARRRGPGVLGGRPSRSFGCHFCWVRCRPEEKSVHHA